LNNGSISSKASDVFGTLLSGQGVGVSSGGLVTNFDFKTTLASRVLSLTGIIKDTRLGTIGGQQLALALANNAIFNTEKNTIGQLDLKPFDILKNGGIVIRPDYTISVPENGSVLSYAEKILGFTLPTSVLIPAGSIFSTESGSISNVERANSMILNTGKGQIISLVAQMNANQKGIGIGDSPDSSPFRSGYVAGYKYKNDFILDGTPKLYAYGDADGKVYNFLGSVTTGSPIPDISVKRNIEQYGFVSPDDCYDGSTIIKPTFSWGSIDGTGVNQNANTVQIGGAKTSLLAKTQKLFNSSNMFNIVSRKGMMNVEPSQIQTAVVGGGISKGSAVKTAAALHQILNTAEETYCRSWTTYDRYDTVNKLIRHNGLNQDINGSTVMDNDHWRLNTKGSVLDDNGFVKIAPYKTDDNTRKTTSAKQYMLSIENLAWAGDPANDLLPSEQGNGDLLSGKFGRIMWFPPYDVTFTENNTANWESTNFIGRGEPIYTYNNSERTGTLSFKVIVDHASQINGFAGPNGPLDDEIDSYFAGCTTIDPTYLDRMTVNETSVVESKNAPVVTKVNVDKEIPPKGFSVYFLNDITEIRTDYENGDNAGIGTYQTEPQTHLGKTYATRALNDTTDFGLNVSSISVDGTTTYNGWNDPAFKTALTKHLTEKCPHCTVNITGYASAQGWKDANIALANNRANNFYNWFETEILPNDAYSKSRANPKIQGKGELSGNYSRNVDYSQQGPKLDRKIDISFTPNATLIADKDINKIKAMKTTTSKVTKKIRSRFYTESSFFDKMTQDDPFVFDRIREKIRYFHPAFHSTTPEGLNSRLTFLNQCTRQGPTLNGDNPENLAFGTPPICILRLGDFYNTKIVIDNIGYDFEQLWDLNPEGIGVQPMIANVNISFKFIGGSSLETPLNKLQNALSFNYYANSQVYDARADYVAAHKTSGNVAKPDTYTFEEGKTKLEFDPTVTTTTVLGVVVKPSIDQVASNDAVNTAQESAPVTDELDKLIIASVVKNSDNIQVVLLLGTGLTTQYTYNCILLDSTSTPILNFGQGNLSLNSPTQTLTFTGFNDNVVEGVNYWVKIEAGNKIKIKSFKI
jgi:hypothetical protein